MSPLGNAARRGRRVMLMMMLMAGTSSAAYMGYHRYQGQRRESLSPLLLADEGEKDEHVAPPPVVNREIMWKRLLQHTKEAGMERAGKEEVKHESDSDSKAMENAPWFDVVIIGGGATGSGCAVDAMSRGYSVALFERGDFASGTSSRATKMAHGGVRYLEKAVMTMNLSELFFVKQGLRERDHFFNVAPHLVSPLPIIAPCYSWFEAAKLYAGLKLYDLLSRLGSGKSTMLSHMQSLGGESIGSYWVSSEKLKAIMPNIATSSNGKLVGGVVYHDAVFNDARLNLSLALTAATAQQSESDRGSVVLNHCEAIRLVKNEKNQISGVVMRDRLTGKEQMVRANAVINATGVFTDTVRQMDDPNAVPIARPSLGVHLTMDASRFCPKDGQSGILVPKTSDGRVMFVVPWEGRCIVGTTDEATTLTETPTPQEKDIEFIRKTMQEYYSIPITRQDILSSWAGIRPLVVPPEKNEGGISSTAFAPRDHFVDVSRGGLVTISGGKWTSFRHMAQEAVDKAAETGQLPKRESSSSKLPLVGSVGWRQTATRGQLVNGLTLEADVRQHLVHCYGDRAAEVAKLARDRNLSKRLSHSLPIIEAEVVYQVQHELACRPTDVIAYRTNLMFLDRVEAQRAVPRVTHLMAAELGWSKNEERIYADEAMRYIEKCTK